MPRLFQRNKPSACPVHHQRQTHIPIRDDVDEREQLVDSLYGVWKDCMVVMNMNVPQDIPRECFLACFHLVGALESVMKAIMLNTPHWKDDLNNVVKMMEEGFEVISELENSEAEETASDISEAEELSDHFQKHRFFNTSKGENPSKKHFGRHH